MSLLKKIFKKKIRTKIQKNDQKSQKCSLIFVYLFLAFFGVSPRYFSTKYFKYLYCFVIIYWCLSFTGKFFVENI